MKENNWDYLSDVPDHRTHYKKEFGIFAGLWKRQVKTELLKLVDLKGKITAEIGCGSGFFGEIAKENNLTITYGIDFTRILLKYAKGKYGKVICADITKHIPLKDNSIDIVFMPGVIACLKDRKKAIKEVHRILKPNGYLILTTVNKRYLDYLNKIKLLIKGRSLKKTKQYYKPLYFNELARLVEDGVGFRIIKHYRTFILWSNQILVGIKVDEQPKLK